MYSHPSRWPTDATDTEEQGRLTYRVQSQDQEIIAPRPIGIHTNRADFRSGLELVGDSTEVIDETYTLPQGKVSTYHNRANELVLRFNRHDHELHVRFRAYDDGVALRYIVPGDGDRDVPEEATSFVIPEGSTVWYHGLASMHYEEKHVKKDVSEIQAGEWVAPPMTVKLPGGRYISVTESGIITPSGQNFAGMAMQADGERGGSHHTARRPQRVSRLPREWLRKAGGDHERRRQKPHGHNTRVILSGIQSVDRTAIATAASCVCDSDKSTFVTCNSFARLAARPLSSTSGRPSGARVTSMSRQPMPRAASLPCNAL